MKDYQAIKKFVVTGDFCTNAPEGWNKHVWSRCCEIHDGDYTVGSEVSRYEADKKLFYCVWKRSHLMWGLTYFIATRAFGWLYYQKIMGK